MDPRRIEQDTTPESSETTVEAVLERIEDVYGMMASGVIVDSSELAKIMEGFAPVLGDPNTEHGALTIFRYLRHRVPPELIFPPVENGTISFSANPAILYKNSPSTPQARNRWHFRRDGQLVCHITSQTDAIELLSSIAMLEVLKHSPASAALAAEFESSESYGLWQSSRFVLDQGDISLPSYLELTNHSPSAEMFARIVSDQLDHQEAEQVDTLMFYNHFGLKLIILAGELIRRTDPRLAPGEYVGQYLHEQAFSALIRFLRQEAPIFENVNLDSYGFPESGQPPPTDGTNGVIAHLYRGDPDKIPILMDKYQDDWPLIELGFAIWRRVSQTLDLYPHLENDHDLGDRLMEADPWFELETQMLLAGFLARYSGNDPILSGAKAWYDDSRRSWMFGERELLAKEASPIAAGARLVDFSVIDEDLIMKAPTLLVPLLAHLRVAQKKILVLEYALGELSYHTAVELAERLPIQNIIEVGKEGVRGFTGSMQIAQVGAPVVTHHLAVSTSPEWVENEAEKLIGQNFGRIKYRAFPEELLCGQLTAPSVLLQTETALQQATASLRDEFAERGFHPETPIMVGMEGAHIARAVRQIGNDTQRQIRMSQANYASDVVGEHPDTEYYERRGVRVRISDSLGFIGIPALTAATYYALMGSLIREVEQMEAG